MSEQQAAPQPPFPEAYWHLFGGPEGLAPERASVQSLSGNGITLAVDQEVGPRTMLWVKLDAAHPRFSQPLLARVTQTGALSGGGWLVACTLVRPLAEEELLAVQGGGHRRPARGRTGGPRPARGA